MKALRNLEKNSTDEPYQSRQIVSKVGFNVLLQQIRATDSDAYVREGYFSKEIRWGSMVFICPLQTKRMTKKFNEGMYLYKRVFEDATLWLKKHEEFLLPKEYQPIVYGKEKKYICGTDLDHAYWRIAYKKKIISKDTYERGLPMPKSLRLSALSCLGKERTYDIYEDGADTKKHINLKRKNKRLQAVYELIRFTCYNMMHQCKNMLGDDFVAYKVDCIYYAESTKNIKLVEDFFEKRGMLTKQLYMKGRVREERF